MLYRAGQYEDAIKELKESMRIRKEFEESMRIRTQDAAAQNASPKPRAEDEAATEMAFDWLFLAMAHQRLGHAEDARAWLRKAVRSMEQTDYERSLEAAFWWSTRLEVQLLRREAETLITPGAR